MIAYQAASQGIDRFPCIHIGMPKTGTKTLQMCLFARHSQVDFLGTYTGHPKRWPRQCRDRDVEELMAELIWDRHERPDLERAAACFKRAVKPSLDRGLTPVWSWESLMENRPEVQRQRAENLKVIFGDCKIIATIRHPIKLLESLYLQLLKRDNIGGMAHVGRPPRYEPIDEWILENWDRIGDAPKSHLEYPEALEIYADVFGRENVGVFLFEQLLNDPRRYYAGVCEFVGIAAEEAISHCEGERENQRWTRQQMMRLQSIHSSWIASTVFRYSPRGFRRRLLGLHDDHGCAILHREPAARATISTPLKERVHEKTRAGNRRLMEQWNLPLADYQYPV